MRIIDEKNKKTLSSILILLNPSEAKELIDKVKCIDTNVGDHIHIDDLQFKREITIAIYTDKNQHYFSEDIRKVIVEDKYS